MTSQPFFDHLTIARLTMAFSLAFHIIFSAIGIAMPFFMATSHFLYLKKKNPIDLQLTKMWSKGVAILFATGAVSGTMLSFELGLLWPEFMKHAGPIIGFPFSLEGTAFFLEAIAIGLFLYGWEKMPPWIHWGSGVLVGISGFASGVFILAANSWMNSPSGFDWVNGQAHNIEPLKALMNKAWFQQTLHMQLAAFTAVGFAVAGIHALLLLKNKNKALNLKAMKIALGFGATAAMLQMVSGHISAQWVAQNQPEKFAAMESHFHTEKGASIILGGIPDTENQTVNYAIKIPKVLSLLAHDDLDAEVKGLTEFPKSNWPPVTIVHFAFQIMVGLGSFLAMIGGLFWGFTFLKKTFPNWLLKLFFMATPLGFLALEAGWTVTEVGRQPWIIYKIMRTSEAVTPNPIVGFHFAIILILYIFLTFICFWLLSRQIFVHNQLAHNQDEK